MATLDKTATAKSMQPGSISYQGELPTTVTPPNFRGEKPPSHFPIAIFTLLGTCNCPFGFLAILFSALSDKAWDSGDRNAAKMRGTIAFILGFLGTVIAFVVSIIVVLAWAAEISTFNAAVGAVALIVFANISAHLLVYALKCTSIKDLLDFNKFVLKN